MSHGVASASSRRNYQSRQDANGKTLTPEVLSQDWKVTKRDGRTEPFDCTKIRHAVTRCFQNGLNVTPDDSHDTVEAVTVRVVNYFAAQSVSAMTIEEVQRAVITQLWADGLAEAAEHYTLYREERRKTREERPIPAHVTEAITEDAQHFPSPLQYYQFLSKFSRWREKDNRRETWQECNNRVFDWFGTIPQFGHLKSEEVVWLRKMMFELKSSPAMRVVQMAGPALERCHVGAYNCAYHPIKDLFSFAELLYILMQGTGGGFSVETDYVDDLPRVKRQGKGKHAKKYKYKVKDSTEGWCDALLFGITKWFSGEDVEFDTNDVRKAGTRLITKGGRASGPESLVQLLTFVRGVILAAQGRRLSDYDVHCICCMIGKIVQVGGVRRASCISISDLNSRNMRHAKHGEWWRDRDFLSMANNSAAYNEKPPVEDFMDEWLALVKSKSGERGIFNREACRKHRPARRKNWKFGCNPCAEIVLRPFQFCNLSIAVARREDTKETLMEKVRAATYFGTLQSCCTNFQYIRKDWKKNCDEERLLGADITGHADCPLLQPGAPGREELLTALKQIVTETNEMLAKRFGINRSAADTTVKPSGDSAVFFDCGSGLSPRFGRHQIRRTRESMHTPMCKFLKESGVPWEVAPEDPSLVAFSWIKKNPEGCTLREDVTAMQQLENWLLWKRHWADHSCSVTIYVKDHEWPAVGTWVWEHFDEITGISFLPWDNGSYKAAPNEVVTEEQYNELAAKFPVIDWAKLPRYEEVDTTTGSRTYACSGDKCEL